MQTEVISDEELTEIFDFYSTASYNVVVHVLDFGNNDTTPPEGFWLVVEVDLTQTCLSKSEKYQKIGFFKKNDHLSTKNTTP